MSNGRQIQVKLSDGQLRIILDLCAKELLREISHNIADPVLAGAMYKIAAGLAPRPGGDDESGSGPE